MTYLFPVSHYFCISSVRTGFSYSEIALTTPQTMCSKRPVEEIHGFPFWKHFSGWISELVSREADFPVDKSIVERRVGVHSSWEGLGVLYLQLFLLQTCNISFWRISLSCFRVLWFLELTFPSRGWAIRSQGTGENPFSEMQCKAGVGWHIGMAIAVCCLGFYPPLTISPENLSTHPSLWLFS